MTNTTMLSAERVDSLSIAGSLLDLARRTVGERGRFTAVLAGGRTPAPVYRSIDRLGAAEGIDWNRWTVLLSDERCVPDSDEARNDVVLRRSLPSLAAAGRIRTVPVGLGPAGAATSYAEVVGAAGPIDLAFLGLGADGHTASLFPFSGVDDAVKDLDALDCRAVLDAPGPFPVRVTLTERALARATAVWFLIDADDRAKDKAVADLVRGEGIGARIAPSAERRVLLLSDRPTAGGQG